MLWFALHLNRLPLEAWQAGAVADAATLDTQPSCVVEARRVVLANDSASAAGVEPGVSVATALSLVAGLQVFARDPVREAALLERLALALARFTPSIVQQPTQQAIGLEVAASLRLFGGPAALWRLIRHAARDAGVRSLRMASAPTAAAAVLLARVEPARSAALRRRPVAERLDALPLPRVIDAWGLEPRLGALLQGVGCRTLGDVRMLPRSGAQRRGLGALLAAIERAHGRAPDPPTWFVPPPTFELGLELLHRADDAPRLVFAAQRLVQPLAGWLTQHGLAAARLALVLHHDTTLRHPLPPTEVVLALGDPSRDAAQITLLLRERLSRTALPAPVYALTLRVSDATPHSARDTALWREHGGGAGAEDARALFDRLAARLGPERVLRPVLAADHRPECAMKLVPLDAAVAPPLPPAGEGRGEGACVRPTWLLPHPRRLAEEPTRGRPLLDGAPLTLLTRAERIEAGWFDGALASRDYHVAQAPDLRCVWVFRERRGDQVQWFLHGLFG